MPNCCPCTAWRTTEVPIATRRNTSTTRTFSVRHSTASPSTATGRASDGVPTHHEAEVPSHSKAPNEPTIVTTAAPNAAGLRM